MAGDGTRFLLEPGLDFKLEAAADGTPPPAPPKVAAPFLLAQSNLSDPAVLLARAEAIVGPAEAYFEDRVMRKRHQQINRLKAARMFDPLYAKAHAATAANIDALQCFKFAKHPCIAPALKNMHAEIDVYNAKVTAIPDLSQREITARDGTKTDSFEIEAWWKEARSSLPNFAVVLRAILCHSPHSCAVERLFSVLNNSFDEQQANAYSDYIELSLQLQFNSRTR